MMRPPLFRRAFHGLLSVLYLSLSLYIISCSFHHDPLQPALHTYASHGHAHAHGHDHGHSKDSGSEGDLFCKLMQNVSGAAVVSSPASPFLLHVASYQMEREGPIVIRTVQGIHPTRAPPFSFS